MPQLPPEIRDIAHAGLRALSDWGARAIAKGVDSALGDVRQGAFRAARELDRRIGVARTRLEKMTRSPYDDVFLCGKCGEWHVEGMTCRSVAKRGRK